MRRLMLAPSVDAVIQQWRQFVLLLPVWIFSALMLCGCGGGGGGAAAVSTNPATAPIIESFVASPVSLTTGASSTLSWSVSGAATLSISPAAGSVSGTTGTLSVSPAATTTYTFTASNTAGTVTATATVTVAPPPVPPVTVTAPSITAFTATPASINTGASATLNWSVAGQATLSINPSVGGVSGATGSVSVSPAATTTYTFTASNTAGTVTATATVTVAPLPVPPVTVTAPSITSFTATPTSINTGASATLNWSVSGQASLSISPGVGTVTGPSGSVTVTPATTTTYILTATNASGTATASTTITLAAGAGVWPPPPQLTALPLSCVTTAMTAASGSTTYTVGPGQKYTSLTSVPWLSLKPGDVVNVNYQPTPYATVIVITVVGTAALPVTINGVTDANCNRPVVSGNNAVVAADAVTANYFGQSPGSYLVGQGLINFAWASNASYPYPAPAYITIQNLEITGAVTGNHYGTGSAASGAWAGSYGIYAVMFSNTTIQNCLIHGNDGGVFFNSQDAQRTSSYVTLRDNIIYGNGLTGSYLYHNIYGQGYRTLYEGNWLGAEMAGAAGSTLKDRSSGTVIRDNYIVASARAIDLVDSETDPTVIGDPLYNYAWIYGNVIIDDFALAQNSGDLIHWGGDSGITANYHLGTLYFYFNTVIVRNITDPGTEVGIFDMPLAAETIEAHSNIFYFSNDAATYWPVSLGICCGKINFADTNWITSGYAVQNSNNNAGTVVFDQNGTLLQGTNPGLNANFTIAAGSPVIGQGVTAPTSVPSPAATLQNLQPTNQYGNSVSTAISSNGNPSIVGRSTATDLGAFSYIHP